MIQGLKTIDWADVAAMLSFDAEHPKMTIPSLPLSARFNAIRHNYRVYQLAVDRGLASWMELDPYETGDWPRLFTPIEAVAWGDIRASRLALWPQLPVDRFFVDFGNPVVKVALECDGAAFHDERKDALRDTRLNELGWTVLRVPGWKCMKEAERPDADSTDEDWARYRFERRWGTMAGVIEEATRLFEQRMPLDMIGEGR